MHPVARAAALGLALAVTLGAPGAASAARPGRLAASCGFSLFFDPTTSDGYAYIDGGPIFQDGRLTCTLQTDAATHAAPPVESVSVSADGIGVVTYLHPHVVEFSPPPLAELYLCTAFTDAGGTTYYYDAVREVWVTDADALCAWAVSHGASPALTTGAPAAPPGRNAAA